MASLKSSTQSLICPRLTDCFCHPYFVPAFGNQMDSLAKYHIYTISHKKKECFA